LQTGRFVKTPYPFLGRIDVVRDTQLLEGVPCLRTTHVTLATRAGRGELTITEIPLTARQQEQEQKAIPLAQNSTLR